MKIPDIFPGKEIYNDALSSAMKQVGGILESGIKAARFLFAPIEYLAAYQDRWQRYLQKVAGRIAEENLMEGHPQIVVPCLEGLSLTTEDSLLSELFINLLSTSIDKTKQDLTHPAFPNIIKQLSYDEAVILFYLKRQFYYLKPIPIDISNQGFFGFREEYFQIENFPNRKLQFQQHLLLYCTHLLSLNIISELKPELNMVGESIYPLRIQLNSFGQLFAKACIPNEFEGL